MSARVTDRFLVPGMVILALLVVAGMVTDLVLPLAGGAAVVLVGLMVFAYPLLMTVLLFVYQVAIPGEVGMSVAVYAGPLRIMPDTLIQIWIFVMWLFAVIDGTGRIQRTRTGKLIVLLSFTGIVGILRGLTAGFDPEMVLDVGRHIPGYLFFFPCMWLLSRKGSLKTLSGTIIAVSIAAALVIILKAFTGGEGVYIREGSGIRVASRELNVVVSGLFLTGFALWKGFRRVPLLPGAVALLVMGAAMLLGQSRAQWLAVIFGALTAFVADTAREGRQGVRLGRILSRSLLIILFAAGSVAVVSAAGLLTAADVAARGSEASMVSGDISLWARFLSWYEILRVVTASPLNLLFGMGFGYPIQYFRPDLISVVSIPYVDGSFFQLLLSTGLTGVIILALLYARGISGAFLLTVKARSEKTALLGAWLLSTLTAMTISALTGSLLTNYRYTCIWAFLFAALETLTRDKGEAS